MALGGVSYRTCHIAILRRGAEQRIAREFSKVEAAPIDARTISTWSIPPSEGYKTPVNFYAAVATGSFFVLTNNREDFEEVANALAKRIVPTELPSGPDLTADTEIAESATGLFAFATPEDQKLAACDSITGNREPKWKSWL